MSGRPPPPGWGWHRLDDGAARDLVVASRVGRGDLVLDLGAGDEAITRHLVTSGARVVAFELHPGRAAALREAFGSHGVRVVVADVADLRLPRRSFRVVSNPPFGVASAVLRRLTTPHSRLVRADLVLPVAVADRWAVRLDRQRAGWALTIRRPIPRRSFHPRPRIDCCAVTLLRRR